MSGNIEGYDLVVTFTKGANNAYIDNIEIGLGNAGGTTGYPNLPTVVNTYPLGDFGYTSAPNGTEWTLSVSVRDILQNGNRTLFPASGTPNELTGGNINLFAVKARYRMASTANATMLRFSSIRLVSRSDEGVVSVLPDSYTLITAFYDIEEQMVSFTCDKNAPASMTLSVPENAFMIRSFVWSDLERELRPLRQKYEALIPFKRSVLFVGGRGAYDSSTKLRSLIQKEGFDIDVACIYCFNRELRDHWRNTNTGSGDYNVIINGSSISTKTSLESALRAGNYDWIVLEQSSGYAGVEDSVFPYITYLEEYIEEKCPHAKICYNTLWPYPSSYEGTIFQFYNNDPAVMRNKINETALCIDDETGVTVINTNDIIYYLANTDGLSLYSKESDTSFYRLNTTGRAAVQAKIFNFLTTKKPAAASLTSVYTGISSAEANAILSYLD